MKTNVLIHIYNEEYLLPFWLEHHKNMFDNMVIVDYRSTDKSVEICKKICPNSRIITSRNEKFDAVKIDEEMMDLENELEGIKIILNVTEFLFCKVPITSMFKENETKSFGIKSYGLYSKNEYNNIATLSELKKILLNNDIAYDIPEYRGLRQIHTFKNGNYTVGRHGTNNESAETNDLYVIWFGFFPFNENTINRKLQIQNNIPKSDKDVGLGGHHIVTKEKLISINEDKINKSKPLKEINPELYDIIKTQVNNEGFEGVERFNNQNLLFYILFILAFFLFPFLFSIKSSAYRLFQTIRKSKYGMIWGKF